jgi:hypothetical protein
LLLFALAFTASGLKAQQTRPSITLAPGSLRLDSLSEKLRIQSGYILAFNADVIDPASMITLSHATHHLENLLNDLKRRYGFSFIILGNHIILNRSIDEKPAPAESHSRLSSQKETIDRTAAPSHEKPRTVKQRYVLDAANVPSAPPEVPSTQTDFFPVKDLSPIVHVHIIPVPTGPMLPFLRKKMPVVYRQIRTSDVDRLLATSGKKNTGSQLFFAGGLTADESFFFSPSLKGGFPFFYLTGSWRTNFSISGFALGFGSSYQFFRRWEVQLNLNGGPLKSKYTLNYGLTSGSPDSSFAIKMKGKLLRGEFFFTNSIGHSLRFQFGPVYNLMNYKIYTNGRPAFETTSFPTSIDANDRFHLLNPPLPIERSYDEKKSSGRMSWIGFQIGLFYFF